MSATFPRFVELEARHGSLIRGMWASQPRTAGPPPTTFCSLQGGLAELVNTLASRLPPESLRSGCPVRAVERREGDFLLSVEGGEPLRSRALVVAVPAPRAARLLAGLSRDLARALASISFVSSATVSLGYRREDVSHPLDGYGLVVPRTEGLRMLALSFHSTKLPGRAPEGHVLLRGFLGGTRDSEVLRLEDRDLVGIVIDEMRPLLGIRGEPVLSRIHRWPEATPQMEVGHAEKIALIDRHVASVPGLFVTGAGIRGTGIPDGIADGTRTAEGAAAFR